MNIQRTVTAIHSRHARALWLVPLALACVALIAACSGGDEGGPTSSGTAAPEASGEFPTGPAVLVAADYQYPGNRVDSTGAYLPANGKPTLVFVDAIW